jgi:Fe-S-cluster containining protein
MTAAPRSEDPASVTIVPETPVVFQCSQCGECCSSWNIPIEKDKADYLRSRPWVQKRFDAFKTEFQPFTKERERIPLTSEQVCVFLGASGECLIESREGRQMKPEECRRFPFATVPRPDGQAAFDASAACKAVAENLLWPLGPIVPEPDAEFSSEPEDGWTVDRSPKRVKVFPWPWSMRVDWDTVRRLEDALRTDCLNPDLTAETVLLRARKRLQYLPGEAITLPDSAIWSAKIADWLSRLLLRAPYGTLSRWQLLTLQANYVDSRIFGHDTPLDLRAIAQLPVERTPDGETLIKAFLWQVLTRKVPLAYGYSLRSRVALACVGLLLVDWHARALAWIQELPCEFGPAELAPAIRLTERYYTGHHVGFLRLIRQPAVSEALPRLLVQESRQFVTM